MSSFLLVIGSEEPFPQDKLPTKGIDRIEQLSPNTFLMLCPVGGANTYSTLLKKKFGEELVHYAIPLSYTRWYGKAKTEELGAILDAHTDDGPTVAGISG